MTVKEAYEKMNGNYPEISSRLVDDKKIMKFLSMFTRDTTFSELCAKMQNESYEEAFHAAHTLKGLCQNLALSGLLEPVAELTECLREGTCEDGALDYFEEVKVRYQEVRDAIDGLSSQT